jgi:hypothetical protein
MQAPISLSAKTSGLDLASPNIGHSNPRYSSRPQNEPVPIQQAATMNPELLALLAETGLAAAEAGSATAVESSFWDLPIPLPIKKSSCVASATYALRTGELVVTLHTSRTRLSYPDTSISTVLAFIRADSPGGFYNRYLRGTE